jgi:hypothetical protein
MSRFVPLAVCLLVLAWASPAIGGAQYQKVDELGHPIGPVTDFDPDAKHETPWLAFVILGGFTAFVAYEFYRQEAICPFLLEGSQRVVPQWASRTEFPLFFWSQIALHAAVAAWMWWHFVFT